MNPIKDIDTCDDYRRQYRSMMRTEWSPHEDIHRLLNEIRRLLREMSEVL